ncbi:MAG: efflux RND transporter periplasmic adaptor subunit, partial [Clostridia bacterium]|nr:efflux RND transporter periplasmic adaptor subunit [Deltaproteobacteria bacterium]
MKLMYSNQFGKAWLASIGALLLLVGCSKPAAEHEGDEHGDEHAEHEEVEKGPHGGRVLAEGDFSVEVTIFEQGVPPEFRVFAHQSGKPIKPSDVKLSIELARFGGRVDRIEFAPKDDYLLGNDEVVEPHSFDVKVRAEHAGKNYEWIYDSYEGRTTIAAEMAKNADVTIATAGPGKLSERLTLHGMIKADSARQRNVTARYHGVIQSVSKQVGDSVRAGETLAVVESNESLQSYAVKAPIAGTITARNANAGETAGSDPLF